MTKKISAKIGDQATAIMANRMIRTIGIRYIAAGYPAGRARKLAVLGAQPLHQLRGRQPLPQGERIGGSEFLPVVVEVGEDLAARAPGGNPATPSVQLRLRVVAAPAAGAV